MLPDSVVVGGVPESLKVIGIPLHLFYKTDLKEYRSVRVKVGAKAGITLAWGDTVRSGHDTPPKMPKTGRIIAGFEGENTNIVRMALNSAHLSKTSKVLKIFGTPSPEIVVVTESETKGCYLTHNKDIGLIMAIVEVKIDSDNYYTGRPEWLEE